MARLQIQELAEAREFNLSRLSKESKTSLTSLRRYWYGTADGKKDGTTRLRSLDIEVLERVADALKVKVGDLFAEDAPESKEATQAE
jgi:hypothetical protein